VFVVHENYPMMPYGVMLDFVNKWLKGIYFRELTFWRWNYFFNFSTPVYKM